MMQVRDFFAMPWDEVKSIPMPASLALAVAMNHQALIFLKQASSGERRLFGGYMEQMRFPDVHTPAARESDPSTSHEAAEHITKTGVRGHQQRQCAEAVKQWPGSTCRELAALSLIPNEVLHKRLSECVTARAVRVGDKRECSVTRRTALVYWPVD
jgi:hypothetical protein